MVSNASWTVRIFSDWMSSCRVKNGCRVADSFEFCWYTTDLIKENSWWGTRRRDIRGHGWPAALREDDDHIYCSVKFNLHMFVRTSGKEVCYSGCPWWVTASATLRGKTIFQGGNVIHKPVTQSRGREQINGMEPGSVGVHATLTSQPFLRNLITNPT